MKPLIALLIVFLLSLVALGLITGEWTFQLPGNIAMSAMLLLTTLGHFKFSKGMAMMFPDRIPFREQIVYATGVLEILAAIGLLIPSTRHLTAWLLILFFILVLPANIYAAIRKVDFQKGDYRVSSAGGGRDEGSRKGTNESLPVARAKFQRSSGNGPRYLWFRVPLQVFFIGWVYYFSIYLFP